MATTFNVKMLDMMEDWATLHGADSIDPDECADWMVDTGLYHREPISAKQQCKKDIRKILQQDTYMDPQGNKVRTKHAVKNWKGKQGTLYPDVRTGKPDMLEEAFQQSWTGIANDVKRHAIEKQSYDDNNVYEVKLPLFDYNFNAQADEARLSGEYDDNYNDEDGDDLG